MSGPKEYPKLKRGSNAQKRIQGFKEETAILSLVLCLTC
ncbi:unnamed protein product [Prunus brigantina]